MSNRNVTSPAPDVSVCDREPIHLPGSIQPHGLLLVANADGRLIAGAGDIEGRLFADWHGRTLDELFGDGFITRLVGGAVESAAALDRIDGKSEIFRGLVHRPEGMFVIELEPRDAVDPTAADILIALDCATAAFERAINLTDLCGRAAGAFRQLTGFDRVMVYRFLSDDTGRVEAESRSDGMYSFLHHRFPASDIPKQARALYVRNQVRVIPDVDYIPAPLSPCSAEIAQLDLSDVTLRSVSPIHIQYLKNMGVAASASVSIVKDGDLWGLIACHSQTPRTLPLVARMACRSLAASLSRQIRAKEEAEQYRERIRLRLSDDSVLANLGGEGSLYDFFAGTGRELQQMFAADSFAAVQGDDIFVDGQSPDLDIVRDIAAWAAEAAAKQPFSTHELSRHFTSSKVFQERASGLLAIKVSLDDPIILMWFRAEEIETINWAGNPHKAIGMDPNSQLTPRASFDAWCETVRGQSRPWTLMQVEGARRLGQTIQDMRQNRRIRELNRELTATNIDNENLLVQKDFLLKEVSHRVQNSLQLVSSFLSMQARAADDEALTAHLDEAQRRISAVALVHRRLYSDNQVEMIDLGRYLGDLCAEIKDTMAETWRDSMTLALAPILISADRAVNVGLILTELVINAQKYAYDGQPGAIAIQLDQLENRFRLIVADRGVGKVRQRRGFGTRMLSAMTRSLSATLEETSNDPGLRVVLTALIH